MDEYLEIGQIVNSYGIKGFLKVVPFTDDITRFEKLKTVYIQYKNNLEEVEIEEVKFHKNLVLLKVKGVNTIEDTLKYKNCYLKINRKDAVVLPEDTYFIVDLIGTKVYDQDENNIGTIIDVFPTGSNDVYVVKNELGKQILLPAISSVIKQVDISNKKMKVNLIEGLV